MKIMLVDDHAIFRQGLRSLLETEDDDIDIVGEASEGLEAVSLAEKIKPDVIIMDISMTGLGGLQATGMIKERLPEIKVIMLSSYIDNVYVKEALVNGASGYINKDAVFGELKVALDAARNDDYYLSPSVLNPLVENYLNAPVHGNQYFEDYNKLSIREKEIFHYISKGFKRKDIASSLNVSPKTVDTHKQNLMYKLKLKNDADIIEFAGKINQAGS